MPKIQSSVSTLLDEVGEPLLTPHEVAALFRVDPKTVTRWARSGRLTSIRTPGGHRRYRESEVRILLQGGEPGRSEARLRFPQAAGPVARREPGGSPSSDQIGKKNCNKSIAPARRGQVP